MKQTTLAALAAAGLAIAMTACAPPPPGPPFVAGAAEHGPYLDRSFEGFVVRAAFVDDVTVIAVQDANDAPEPTAEDFAAARLILRDGSGIEAVAELAADAPRFEAAAKEASTVPGWCPFNTRFEYQPAVAPEPAFPFTLRGDYAEGIKAFVFAGLCRPQS